ncbi:MAG: SrfA family protein [Minwuia sp.]|uniref:SrfA family protein n=1 Tax=Minwuia sp. TaxID=2493630 RepID=UPI003A88330C
MDRTGPVLAEEELDRYQPLGAFGQPVYQSHMQLKAALGQRLGDRYADFFAIPRIDSQGKRVSWISPVEGEPRRWSDMPEEEQASRALDLQVMKSEFDTYLGELRAYEQQGKDPRGARAFVAVMEQALRTPNDGHLHFVGDQPVSTFWGFREEENPPFETLTAAPRVAAAPAAAAASTVAASRGFSWWWLLIPLLLLLAFLLWWFWPEDLPVVEGESGAAIEEPVGVTEPEPERPLVEDPDNPAVIERDGVIIDRDGVVVPDGAVTESPDGAVIDETPVTPEDGALTPDGATDGDAPAEPEAPAEGETPPEDQQATDPEAPQGEEPNVPEPPSPDEQTPPEDQQNPQDPDSQQGQDQPQPDAQDPGAPPAIPDGAQDGAAGFMQGNWQSDAGLVDSQTRQKLTQEYNFDENGQGEAVIRRSDGVTCRAPAEATVQGGNLQVEEKSNLQCSDGSSFKRSRTVCTNTPSGKAECIGTDADGNRFKVDLNRGGQP